MPRRVPFDPARHEPENVRRQLVQLRETFPEAGAFSSAQGQSYPRGGQITLCFARGVTVYASPPGGYMRRRRSDWYLDIGGTVHSPADFDAAVKTIRATAAVYLNEEPLVPTAAFGSPFSWG